MFYRDYFTVDVIAEIMAYIMEEYGVNAIISSPRDNIKEAIDKVEKQTGRRYIWICSPSERDTAKGCGQTIFDQIKWCADNHVSVCMPHRSWTDAYMNTAKAVIEGGLPEITAAIRDHGMIPGLSTHYYEAISICRQQKYDVKLIVQPLNVLGFQSNIEVNTLVSSIKGTQIQILNIKPMAAGRVLPEIGLNFCFNNIKDNDLVAAGFSSMHDADYDFLFFNRVTSSNTFLTSPVHPRSPPV